MITKLDRESILVTIMGIMILFGSFIMGISIWLRQLEKKLSF